MGYADISAAVLEAVNRVLPDIKVQRDSTRTGAAAARGRGSPTAVRSVLNLDDRDGDADNRWIMISSDPQAATIFVFFFVVHSPADRNAEFGTIAQLRDT